MGCAMKRQDTAAKNWVPNVEPAPAAPARPAPTVELVSGKVLDNLWGGVGVAVALSAIYALLRIGAANLGMMGLPDWQHAAWAGLVFALTGALAFGALTAWRASLDERERQGDINAMAARIADDDDYIDKLEAKVEELRSRLDSALLELQHEQAQARATMAQSRQFVPAGGTTDEPIDKRTYDDAVILTERSTRNLDYSRDKVCQELGWTTTRWYAARDVLVECGNWRRDGQKTTVLVSDTHVALRNLAIFAGMP